MRRLRMRNIDFVNDREHLRKLLEVAHLYYVGKRTLKQIAKITQRDTNIWPIRRLLVEAEVRGFVKVEPRFNPPRLTDLELKLMRKFRNHNLNEAIVIPSSRDFEFHREMLGKAAADYVDPLISEKSGLKIGITGGRTALHLVKALPEKQRNIELYPLALLPHSGVVQHVAAVSVMNELRMRSGNQGATLHLVTITPFEPQLTLEQIVKDSKDLGKKKVIAGMLNEIKNVDIAITSCGDLNQHPEDGVTLEPLGAVEGLGIKEKDLKAHEIIGDIAYCLINKEGKTPAGLESLPIIGVDTLKEMASQFPQKKVIVVAGRHKEGPLRAAIGAGLCNVVVTDENTAADHLLKD